MNYLLYGIEEYQIKQEIKKIIKKNNIEKENIINYSFDNNIKSIIDDASTLSLFASNKLIIIDCNDLFSKDINNIDYFEAYLNNPNPSTIMIFTLYQEKIDTRKKVYKIFSKCAEVLVFNNKINIYDFIKKELKDYNINSNDINLIVKRLGNNPSLVSSELEKLKIYKDNDKNITYQDIINIISNYVDLNIFKFMDNIIFKNKKEAIRTYHEMLKIGEEPIKLITMLANNFRLIFQAKNLRDLGKNEKDIMNITGKGSYPIKLALEKGYKYDNQTLINIIEKLADLDYQMKISDIEKNLAFELFILQL